MKKRANNRKTDPAQLSRIGDLVQRIISQCVLVRGDPQEVLNACTDLRHYIDPPLSGLRITALQPLFPLLQKQSGTIALHLFDLLSAAAKSVRDPIPLFIGLLLARDSKLVNDTFVLILQMAADKRIEIDRRLLLFIAGRINSGYQKFAEAPALEMISKILHLYLSPVAAEKHDLLKKVLCDSRQVDLHALAARLLDHQHVHPDLQISEALLGKKTAAFLFPYLSYTNATFPDLLLIRAHLFSKSEWLGDLIQGEKKIGKNLMRQLIAKIGWKNLNRRFILSSLSYLTFAQAPPLVLHRCEARLFNGGAKTTGISDFYFVVSQGSTAPSPAESKSGADPVNRFRAYNVNHSELLTCFLDVHPLTSRRVIFILKRMKKIVADFVYLFKEFDDECQVLPALFENLREKIIRELKKSRLSPQLSADLTRLVQAFEDPHTLGEVRTMHGLKRYLHQKGLSLGFKLVAAADAPNQSVSLAMLSFSNFGSVEHPHSLKVRRATEIIRQHFPDLNVDGEMQLATARDVGLRATYFPFTSLENDANVLIFPDLQSGNLAMHALQYMAEALPIGPVLMGTRLPAHLIQYGATVEEVVNLTTVGAVEAMVTI